MKLINLVYPKKARTINFKDSNFDFDLFLSKIDTTFVDDLNSIEFKNLIVNASSVYNISLQDMVSIYNQSIGSNYKFSNKLFKERTRLYYNMNKTETTVPVLKTNNEKESDLYQLFDELTPQEILNKFDINDGYNLRHINDVYAAIPFDDINITKLMVYNTLAYKKKNNEEVKVPSANYFVTMFNAMKDHKVNTFEDANKFLVQYDYDHSKNSNNNYKNKTKEKVTTDWADESLKRILKGFEDE